LNILDENINKEPFKKEEDMIVIKRFLEYGPKWSLISKFLKGRRDN